MPGDGRDARRGQTEGESILGSLADGQRVIIEDGVAKMPDRTAFAAACARATGWCAQWPARAARASPTPCTWPRPCRRRALGLEQVTGHVAVGRAADLVLFDSDVRVRLVLVDGAVRFRAEERKDER